MAVQVQRSRLLNLPAELRLEIYGYALEDPPEEILDCWLGPSQIHVWRVNEDGYPTRLPDPYSALLETCKQLHKEVLDWARSRQVLRLWASCRFDHPRSRRYLQLESFKIPEYCRGTKVEMNIHLPYPQVVAQPQHFQKVFGNMAALAHKARLDKFTDLTITSLHTIDEENICALLRGLPSMCVRVGQPNSIVVQEENMGFVDFGYSKKEKFTSDFIAAVQTAEKCEYEYQFL